LINRLIQTIGKRKEKRENPKPLSALHIGRREGEKTESGEIEALY
jgi:hypothetical protein